MIYIIGKKDNKDCCWFGAYSKKADAQKDLKHLKLRLPTIEFRIKNIERKNYINFVVQGAMTLAPMIIKFGKNIPSIIKSLKPYGKQFATQLKKLKDLPKMILDAVKQGKDWLLPVSLIITDLKELVIELIPKGKESEKIIKQLTEMENMASKINDKANKIEEKAQKINETIPK